MIRVSRRFNVCDRAWGRYDLDVAIVLWLQIILLVKPLDPLTNSNLRIPFSIPLPVPLPAISPSLRICLVQQWHP